jgi:hypothetical protein
MVRFGAFGRVYAARRTGPTKGDVPPTGIYDRRSYDRRSYEQVKQKPRLAAGLTLHDPD